MTQSANKRSARELKPGECYGPHLPLRSPAQTRPRPQPPLRHLQQLKTIPQTHPGTQKPPPPPGAGTQPLLFTVGHNALVEKVGVTALPPRLTRPSSQCTTPTWYLHLLRPIHTPAAPLGGDSTQQPTQGEITPPPVGPATHPRTPNQHACTLELTSNACLADTVPPIPAPSACFAKGCLKASGASVASQLSSSGANKCTDFCSPPWPAASFRRARTGSLSCRALTLPRGRLKHC